MINASRQRQQGFTIIEIVSVLVVLAILSMIATGSFQSYLQQARRDDARDVLALNSQRLKRCFTLEGVYNGSCVVRTASEAGLYQLSTTLSATTFELVASPVEGSSQQSDADCQSFVLDHTGLKSATGDNPDTCWF